MSFSDLLHTIFEAAATMTNTSSPAPVKPPVQTTPVAPTPTPVAKPVAVTGVLSALPAAIKAVAPKLPADQVAAWAAAFAAPMTKAGMTTARRAAAFLGQLAEETGEFTVFQENLNYSAARLMQVWPSRFPTLAVANTYQHNPQKLASYVYANRLGNGDAASGDGWIFRGAGPIQLTGKSTFAAFGATVGKTAEEAAAYVQTPEGGAASACWYWTSRSLNPLADAWNISGITTKVNGGLTNEAVRLSLSETELKAFGG